MYTKLSFAGLIPYEKLINITCVQSIPVYILQATGISIHLAEIYVVLCTLQQLCFQRGLCYCVILHEVAINVLISSFM